MIVIGLVLCWYSLALLLFHVIIDVFVFAANVHGDLFCFLLHFRKKNQRNIRWTFLSYATSTVYVQHSIVPLLSYLLSCLLAAFILSMIIHFSDIRRFVFDIRYPVGICYAGLSGKPPVIVIHIHAKPLLCRCFLFWIYVRHFHALLEKCN